jgi:hypothetical protein
MTLPSFKHAFTNPQADGPDATITRPSDWNAEHVLLGLALGQCRLTVSGGNLLLSRWDGNALFIQDRFREVPASGPTLAATGLTPNTTYYIYASWSGSAIVLDASTTGYANDTTYGHRIKTGDNTRTLVGMARCVTGPAWSSNASLTRSWFNTDKLRAVLTLGTDRSTTSTSNVETNSADRVEFLLWSHETFGLSGFLNTWLESAGACRMFAGIMVDGVLLSQGFVDTAGVEQRFVTTISPFTSPAEGYHYGSISFSTSNGTSITIHASNYTTLRFALC